MKKEIKVLKVEAVSCSVKYILIFILFPLWGEDKGIYGLLYIGEDMYETPGKMHHFEYCLKFTFLWSENKKGCMGTKQSVKTWDHQNITSAYFSSHLLFS
jgi:hypothetical protein